MTVLSGRWGVIVASLGECLSRPCGVSRLPLRDKAAAEKAVDEEVARENLALAQLSLHHASLTRYFKEVIEYAQLPELIVDDFSQDIFLHIWQTQLNVDWQSVAFEDLVSIGQELILDRLIPLVRFQFESQFPRDEDGQALFEKMLLRLRETFLRLPLDPYLHSDWRSILQVLATDIFESEFQSRLQQWRGGSRRVADGKVTVLKSVDVSNPTPEAEIDGVSTWTNPLKIEAIFKALKGGKTNLDFRHCIYRQLLSFSEKFEDIWEILSLQIWESVSTKEAASKRGLTHNAFRERCRLRGEAMINHLRVCSPLIEGEEHE